MDLFLLKFRLLDCWKMNKTHISGLVNEVGFISEDIARLRIALQALPPLNAKADSEITDLITNKSIERSKIKAQINEILEKI